PIESLEVSGNDALFPPDQVFRPPFEEFEIQQVEVPAGESVRVPTNPGPLLLLVQSGAGSARAAGGAADGASLLQQQIDLHRGSVVFVPAGAAVTYTASGSEGLSVWAAAVNAKVFAPAAEPAAAEEEVGVGAEAGEAAVPEPALVAA
ncbi:hypothetical protein Rsub_05942, partial [Raphidocelis subcapitata]